MRIAYVVYPDFTGLDLVGPYEVISRWPDADVHFVASSPEPVRADRGLTVIPTDTPDTMPQPDLIVVPGSQNPVPVLGGALRRCGSARGQEDDDALGVPRQPAGDGRRGGRGPRRLAGHPHKRRGRLGRHRHGAGADRPRPRPRARRVPAAARRVRPAAAVRLRLAGQGRRRHATARVPDAARRPTVPDGGANKQAATARFRRARQALAERRQ